MAEWLPQASQWHEMYCHDLEVMSSNPSQVELGEHCTSVLSRTWIKNNTIRLFVCCHFKLNTNWIFLHESRTILTSCLLKQQVQFSGSLVFRKYVVEILKIETAFFINKWIKVLRIRSCACCGYAFSLWRDICGFYNQENGHWNHPCGFSLDRHIYLSASHCHTQLKLDAWLIEARD